MDVTLYNVAAVRVRQQTPYLSVLLHDGTAGITLMLTEAELDSLMATLQRARWLCVEHSRIPHEGKAPLWRTNTREAPELHRQYPTTPIIPYETGEEAIGGAK